MVSGEVLLKFTVYDPLNPTATDQQLLQKFFGICALEPEEEDEDLDELERIDTADLDDEDEQEPSDETDDAKKEKRKKRHRLARLKRKTKLRAYEFSGMSDVAGVLFLEIQRITDLPPERNSRLIDASTHWTND